MFDRRGILGSNQLTDGYLLALAVSNGGRLATLDGSVPLGAVRGAQSQHLVTLERRQRGWTLRTSERPE